MYDHALFVRTTSEFTGKVLSHHEVGEVLADLADRLRELLGLAGGGVTLGMGGRLRVMLSEPSRVAPLEAYQEQHQEGPCVEAYQAGENVPVPDLLEETRWPGYRTVAGKVGVRAVVGVPMRLGEHAVGALDMYSDAPREWPQEDLQAASVLANMATGYLINASSYTKQSELTRQLQHALDSRVVVEQAKGVLAGSLGISVDAAFERIRRHARGHNATVAEVARAVVNLGLRL